MTQIKRIPLAEVRVEGKRLGRHILHDERSKMYPANRVRADSITAVSWPTVGLPLDQGNVGSCTAEALVGARNAGPNIPWLKRGPFTQHGAGWLYHCETVAEGQPWPPNDPGGTGLEVCKAAQRLGWIRSYGHSFGVDQAIAALMIQPFITGVNWYEGFDTPDANGLVHIGGQVRGGHEFLGLAYDPASRVVGFMNSWGPTWGQQGRFWMDYTTFGDLLEQGGDVTVPMA